MSLLDIFDRGTKCHCILQVRSYAGEVELRQSRCVGMLIVFSEENAYLLSCLSTHFVYLFGPRQVILVHNNHVFVLMDIKLLKVLSVQTEI